LLTAADRVLRGLQYEDSRSRFLNSAVRKIKLSFHYTHNTCQYTTHNGFFTPLHLYRVYYLFTAIAFLMCRGEVIPYSRLLNNRENNIKIALGKLSLQIEYIT
jgi:hypothetical protein